MIKKAKKLIIKKGKNNDTNIKKLTSTSCKSSSDESSCESSQCEESCTSSFCTSLSSSSSSLGDDCLLTYFNNVKSNYNLGEYYFYAKPTYGIPEKVQENEKVSEQVPEASTIYKKSEPILIIDKKAELKKLPTVDIKDFLKNFVELANEALTIHNYNVNNINKTLGNIMPEKYKPLAENQLFDISYFDDVEIDDLIDEDREEIMDLLIVKLEEIVGECLSFSNYAIDYLHKMNNK